MLNWKVKKFFSEMFLVQVECCLSFAVIGSIFAKDVQITFSYFFIPLILGFLCMIPCIILYIKEDLSIPQVIFQRVSELVVIEFVVIYMANKIAGSVLGFKGLVWTGIITLIIDVASYVNGYLMEKTDADKLNRILEEHRKHNV